MSNWTTYVVIFYYFTGLLCFIYIISQYINCFIYQIVFRLKWSFLSERSFLSDKKDHFNKTCEKQSTIYSQDIRQFITRIITTRTKTNWLSFERCQLQQLNFGYHYNGKKREACDLSTGGETRRINHMEGQPHQRYMTAKSAINMVLWRY